MPFRVPTQHQIFMHYSRPSNGRWNEHSTRASFEFAINHLQHARCPVERRIQILQGFLAGTLTAKAKAIARACGSAARIFFAKVITLAPMLHRLHRRLSPQERVAGRRHVYPSATADMKTNRISTLQRPGMYVHETCTSQAGFRKIQADVEDSVRRHIAENLENRLGD